MQRFGSGPAPRRGISYDLIGARPGSKGRSYRSRSLERCRHSFPSALGSWVSYVIRGRETLISSFGDLDCRFCLRDNWTSETGICRHASAYCTKFYCLIRCRLSPRSMIPRTSLRLSTRWRNIDVKSMRSSLRMGQLHSKTPLSHSRRAGRHCGGSRRFLVADFGPCLRGDARGGDGYCVKTLGTPRRYFDEW